MPYKWAAFSVISVGVLLSSLELGALNLALPALSRLFTAPPDQIIWVVLAYSLTFTGFTLTAGRIADIFGRKQVYVAGFLLITVGLVLNSLAQELWQLIASRAFQAIGGSVLVGNSNALLTTAFPEQERGKALGLLESVVGAGLMLGPLVGGVLLDLLGWRAIFYTRIPLGLFGGYLAWRVLLETPRQGARPSFDIGGSLTMFGSLVCLMLTINQGYRLGWTSPAILALGTAAVVLLAVFVVIERRVQEPVLDLTLLARPAFLLYSLVMLAFFLTFAAVSLLLPFYLVEGMGYSAAGAGVFLTIIPISMLVLSPLTGLLADRFGSWLLTTLGLALAAAGVFLVSRLGQYDPAVQAVVRLAITSVGAGLFLTPTYSAVMGAAPLDRLSTVSAYIATLRSVGQSGGTALSATIFAAQQGVYEAALASRLAPDEVQRQALIYGFQDALLVVACAVLAGFVAMLVFGRRAERQARARDELLEPFLPFKRQHPAKN